MFCNGPHAVTKQHKHVRWYLAGLGSSHGLHGPYISGHVLRIQFPSDAQRCLLAPGMTRTVDVNATEFGKWLVRDAVLSHQHSGMGMFFNIKEVLHYFFLLFV